MQWLLPPGEKESTLKSLSLFASCSRKHLRRVAELAVEQEREPGEILTRQGEKGATAYIIVSGEAEVVRDGRLLARLGPADVVGEMCLLDGGPRAATVTITANTRLLALPAEDFQTLLAELPELSLQLLGVLAGRLRRADERMAALQ